MSELAFALDREVVICARRETVFGFFTDKERFAKWWGPGSEIEGRVGAPVVIRYPNGVVARGEVLEVDPPSRIVLSYGYEGAGKPIAPGASRVTITLESVSEGTRLRLRHEMDDKLVRDEHVQGWRYQLALFANAAADVEQAAVATRVDALLEAWSEPDPERRRRLLAQAALPSVTFRDPFSATSGLEDLQIHLAAAQFHMPGVRLEREGDVRHCQGTAMAHWVARAADGTVRGRGTNVYDLAPDGRVHRVVGFWG